MHELGEIHSFNRISSQSWLSCSENRISEPFSNVSRVTCNPQIGYHENISTWTTENQPQCSFHVKPPILDQNSSDASRNPTAAAPPRSNNATLNLPTASLRASNFCTSKHNHNHNHNHNHTSIPVSSRDAYTPRFSAIVRETAKSTSLKSDSRHLELALTPPDRPRHELHSSWSLP